MGGSFFCVPPQPEPGHTPEMERLRCGAILSSAFLRYVEERYETDAAQAEDEILSVEYLRVAEGELGGRSWWRESWIPRDSIPDHEIFRTGRVHLHIPLTSQRGLKDRFADIDADGKVTVS